MDNSLKSKLDELNVEIAVNEPDIICLTEIKPKNGQIPDKTQLEINGYDLFLNPAYENPETRGTCIYTKQFLNASDVATENTKAFKDSTWVEIIGKNRKLLISSVYRSGTQDKAKKLDKELHSTMKTMSLNKEYSQIVITGDFNHPSIKWTEAEDTDGESIITPQSDHGPDHCDAAFIECIEDSLLQQHVTKPTRSRENQTPTLDDLIFTNDDQTLADLQHKHHLGMSDHQMLSFNINFNFDKPKTLNKTKLNFQRADIPKMKQMLSVDWKAELDDKTPEEAYNVFLTRYNTAVEECVPKSITRVSNKYVKPMWMKSDTLKLIKKKHNSHTRYLNTKQSQDYDNYKLLRNKVCHQVKADRKYFEERLAKEVKENTKIFWKYVNSSKKTKSSIPNLKRSDGTFSSSDQQKADLLNQQFASVFTLEDVDDIPVSEDLNLEYLLENILVTEEKVKEKLLKLRADKAPGPDSVHPLVLKKLADTLCKPLAQIYNLSLSTQMLPKAWKTGNIAAIFKKGDKTLPQNYRPVQLTSIVCKIIESIITEAILKHLALNNLEDLHQHGFTHGKSTVTNLIQALNVWSEALSHGIPVDVIYLDYEKAFDKVPHQRLLKEIHRQGIRGAVYGWIAEFLNNRQQRVRVNDEYSDFKTVLSGVPQGSVLGPTLFLLYVSQIPSLLKNFTSLFADDTKIFTYLMDLQSNIPETELDHTPYSLQTDMNLITNWSEKYQMSFNQAKCHVLHLGHNNPKASYTMYKQTETVKTPGGIKYTLKFHTLETVEEEVDLGITVDSKLKFSKHVDVKVNKANKLLGLLRHTFKYLNAESLTLLYKSIIRPHLEYATSVWSPHLKGDKDKVERVQRRATKQIPQLQHLSYQERLQHLKLPTLEYRRLRTDLILLYKHTHQLIKIDTNTYCLKCKHNTNMLQPAARANNRGHNFKFQVHHHVGVRDRFYTSRILKTWNNLQLKTVNATSLNAFKTLLKSDPSMPDRFAYKF